MSDLSYAERCLADGLRQVFLGKKIGEGIHREVYEVLPFVHGVPCVAKVAKGIGGLRANFLEWETWVNMDDTEIKKWIAPCVDISDNGNILIQHRTEPTRRMPKEIPSIFTDLKPENWGELNGKTVCHDYANNLVFEIAAKKMRMKKWNA